MDFKEKAEEAAALFGIERYPHAVAQHGQAFFLAGARFALEHAIELTAYLVESREIDARSIMRANLHNALSALSPQPKPKE